MSNLGRVEPINWIRQKAILVNFLTNKVKYTLMIILQIFNLLV